MGSEPFDLDAVLGQQDDEDVFDLDALLSQSKPKPAPKPKSTWEKIQEASTRGLYEAGQGLAGLAKGGAKVVADAAKLPGDIVSGGTSLLIDKLGNKDLIAADIERARRKYELDNKILDPLREGPNASVGEKIGRGVAQAAPQIGLAALTGGASLPAQMALAGGAQTAQSLAEGGDLGGTALSAGLATVAPGAGKLVSKFGGRLANKAVEQYSKALNPTKIATKKETQEIVPELLKRGVTGNLEELAGVGSQRSSVAGKALDAAYKDATQAGRTVNAVQIADDLEQLKAPFIVQSGAGNPVVANQGAVQSIENIQSALRDLGDNVAPDQLWKFRQNVDDIVRATNGFSRELPRGKAASIAKQARASIQKELTAAVPDVDRLNAEYRLWQSLEHVAKDRMNVQTGQQGARGWLARGIGATVGGIAGSSGGPVGAATGAFAGQEATARIAAAMASPQWRTVSAVQKAKLARLLTSGKPEAAINYLGRLVASSTSSGQSR
jgi:hypothetical protein